MRLVARLQLTVWGGKGACSLDMGGHLFNTQIACGAQLSLIYQRLVYKHPAALWACLYWAALNVRLWQASKLLAVAAVCNCGKQAARVA